MQTVKDLIKALYCRAFKTVYHEDAEHGLTKVELSVEKVIQYPQHRNSDGSYTDAGYLAGFKKEALAELKDQISKFSEANLVSEHTQMAAEDQRIIDSLAASGNTEESVVWETMRMDLPTYIELMTDQHLLSCEIVRRCNLVEYSTIIKGT